MAVRPSEAEIERLVAERVKAATEQVHGPERLHLWTCASWLTRPAFHRPPRQMLTETEIMAKENAQLQARLLDAQQANRQMETVVEEYEKTMVSAPGEKRLGHTAVFGPCTSGGLA